MNEERGDLLSDFTPEERFLLKKALSRLSAHDDTPRRLCERLMKLEYKREPVSTESCKKVVRFLHAQGLLREAAYAEDLVRALKSRGYGRQRIRRELIARKFSAHHVERIAEVLASEAEAELSRANDMLRRRASARKSDLSDRAEREKLFSYLVRLGYESDVARLSLKQLTEEKEEN